MTPDSPESRIGRLEQDAARLAQRVEDLDRDVRTFAPMIIGLTRLEEAVKAIKGDVKACAAQTSELRKTLTDRESESKRERRSLQIALVAMAATLGAAVISTLGALIVAGVL